MFCFSFPNFTGRDFCGSTANRGGKSTDKLCRACTTLFNTFLHRGMAARKRASWERNHAAKARAIVFEMTFCRRSFITFYIQFRNVHARRDVEDLEQEVDRAKMEEHTSRKSLNILQEILNLCSY